MYEATHMSILVLLRAQHLRRLVPSIIEGQALEAVLESRRQKRLEALLSPDIVRRWALGSAGGGDGSGEVQTGRRVGVWRRRNAPGLPRGVSYSRFWTTNGDVPMAV